MEKYQKKALLPWALLGAAGLCGILLWPVLRPLAGQVLTGYGLMGLALPLCRAFEKRLPPGFSAALALLCLVGGGAAVIALGIPPLVRQGEEALALLPELLERIRARAGALPDLSPLVQWAPRLLSGLGEGLSGLGRLMLSPVLAFYFLRDRVRAARWLTLLIPLGYRARAVSAAREARREMGGFLRGQALICLCVGGLTALGLGAVGVKAWLFLGLFMGVMELIPYLGPVLAGIPVILFALPLGWARTLWALGVMLLVQQLEGTVLAPRLMAGAAGLHPAWVLILISLGSLLAGVTGMLLILPLAVALRGALRGWQR